MQTTETSRTYRFLVLAAILLVIGVAAYFSPRRSVQQPGPKEKQWEQPSEREQEIRAGQDTGPIRCTLRHYQSRAVQGEHRPPELEIEFHNTSDQPVSFWYSIWPHYHVTFLLRDSSGEVVSTFPYESLSSLYPSKDCPVLTLQPGESYMDPLYSSVITEHILKPHVRTGAYTLEAVFAYKDLDGFPAKDQHMLSRSRPMRVVDSRIVLNE